MPSDRSHFERLRDRLDGYRSEGYTPEFSVHVSPQFYRGLLREAPRLDGVPSSAEYDSLRAFGHELTIDDSLAHDSMYIETIAAGGRTGGE